MLKISFKKEIKSIDLVMKRIVKFAIIHDKISNQWIQNQPLRNDLFMLY